MNNKTQDLPTIALIVAAGRGTRAGGDIPKQWQTLAGKRVLDHTLAAFAGHSAVSRIYLVLHADDMLQASGFRAQGVHVVEGGADRAGSVREGLDAIAADYADDTDSIVMIHDAARPCVSARVIDGVLDALKQADGAAPGLPLTDALWIQKGTRVSGTQDRNGLIGAQTPQAFRLSGIRRAHATYYGMAADDVEVARVAGLSVAITPGSADNLKITLPEDFKRAARILESQMDIRTGNGFDVHAFGTGDHVMLCGVKIPHGRGLIGHSDADVGLHTLSDAIYGALAEGDIGTHFPPSDPQWKGAQSHIFLRHAAELARSKGFEVTHLDLTLICEEPKIGPHASAMRAAVAEMVSLESDRVSVKATTSEQLGFTGRREGIAAMATATLVKR